MMLTTPYAMRDSPKSKNFRIMHKAMRTAALMVVLRKDMEP